jgi:hypothetical protein
MSVQSSSTDCPVSPTQIWVCLATELQERAIRLMARLAFNLAAAQSGWPVAKDKESSYAITPHQPQNPV